VLNVARQTVQCSTSRVATCRAALQNIAAAQVGNGRQQERAQVGVRASGKRAPSEKQGALEDGDVVLRAVVRRSGDGDDRPLVGQVHSAARTRRAGERANKQTNKQTNKQRNKQTDR
jgi:hypothetical protein